MVHIHTTAAAVSKLKKKAKQHAKLNGVQHASALDAVSREANYASWHHVLKCALNSGQAQVDSSSLQNFASEVYDPAPGSITFIRGGPGTGKSALASLFIRGSVNAQKGVIAIDLGGTYGDLVEAAGGTIVALTPDGFEVQLEGDNSTILYETASLEMSSWRAFLPRLEDRDKELKDTVVVIDEAWGVTSRVAVVHSFVEEVIQAGGSAIVCCQEEWDSPVWAPFMAIPARRFPVDLSTRSFQSVVQAMPPRIEQTVHLASSFLDDVTSMDPSDATVQVMRLLPSPANSPGADLRRQQTNLALLTILEAISRRGASLDASELAHILVAPERLVDVLQALPSEVVEGRKKAAPMLVVDELDSLAAEGNLERDFGDLVCLLGHQARRNRAVWKQF